MGEKRGGDYTCNYKCFIHKAVILGAITNFLDSNHLKKKIMKTILDLNLAGSLEGPLLVNVFTTSIMAAVFRSLSFHYSTHKTVISL